MEDDFDARKKGFFQLLMRNRLTVVGLIGVLVIVLMGIFAPFIAEKPKGYGSEILLSPSTNHWFGTDNLGLDIFAEMVWGARTSLFVSLVAVLVAIVIGVPAGMISGYKKGVIGSIIDSLIDIFLTLPILPLMIVIAAVIGSSILNVAVIIGIFSWPSLARVTRNATLKISELQFIEVAKCLGIPTGNIIFKHILLNIMGPILVNITLIMATAVLSEAGLSFLGLGDPTTWSWG